MKYHIDQQAAGLSICVEEIAGHEQEVIEAIRRCRQSAWACPSGECRNIEAIGERAEPGRVVFTLTPKAGVALDAAGIDVCLRYMLAGAIKP